MNKKQGLGPLVWVIIAAILIGGGYFTFAVLNQAIPELQSLKWSTYVNEEYGFEFKYYGDWVANESGTDESLVSFGPEPDNGRALHGLGVKIYLANAKGFFGKDSVRTLEELKMAVERRYAKDNPEIEVKNLGGFDVVIADGLPGIAGNESSAYVLLDKEVLNVYPGEFVDWIRKIPSK